MVSFVGRPLLFVLLTAFVIYGSLVFVQVWPDSNAATSITSVLFLGYAIVSTILVIFFVKDYFDSEYVPLSNSLWGFVNILIVSVHVLAS